jgi:cytochrome b subunit of formate dehydrogenase
VRCRLLAARLFYIGEIMFEAIMKKNEAVTSGKFSDFVKYIMAAGGISIGILLMLTGLILWAVSGFENKNHDPWELILFVSAFVLLGIGAHGLDLMHSAKREEKNRSIYK